MRIPLQTGRPPSAAAPDLAAPAPLEHVTVVAVGSRHVLMSGLSTRLAGTSTWWARRTWCWARDFVVAAYRWGVSSGMAGREGWRRSGGLLLAGGRLVVSLGGVVWVWLGRGLLARLRWRRGWRRSGHRRLWLEQRRRTFGRFARRAVSGVALARIAKPLSTRAIKTATTRAGRHQRVVSRLIEAEGRKLRHRAV